MQSYKNNKYASDFQSHQKSKKKKFKSFLEFEKWTFIFVHFLFSKKLFVKNVFCDHN